MIEVRGFEGDSAELQNFLVRIWRQTYEGVMPFTLWSAEYFDWQFGLNEGLPRDHLLTAYDGRRIAGTLLGIPFQFHHERREFMGTIGGWLTVDPEVRGQGIGSKLREELMRVHQAQDMDGQLGYVYLGSKSAQGNPFWKKAPKTGSQQRFKKLGFWARMLDPKRAAKWNYHRVEAFLMRAGSPFVFAPRAKPTSGIRPYQPADLPDCLKLVREMSLATDLGILWNSDNLGRHLEGRGVGRCLVFVVNGRVQGLCAYHVLPVLGRVAEPVGIIDIVAIGTLKSRQQVALINHCLHDMRQSGAILATKLRSGDASTRVMIRCGFVPAPADHFLCMNWVDPARSFPKVRTTHILWR